MTSIVEKFKESEKYKEYCEKYTKSREMTIEVRRFFEELAAEIAVELAALPDEERDEQEDGVSEFFADEAYDLNLEWDGSLQTPEFWEPSSC